MIGLAMSIWLTWLSEEGKDILGILRWSPGYCSAVMEGFVVGAAPVSCTAPRLKQGRRDNVNLSRILIASPIQDKVLDVKYISRSSLNLTVETEFNCRN